MTQVISYPLLLKVKQNIFNHYYNSYTRRISIIVIPLMFFELLLSTTINITFDNAYIAASNILLLIIWGSTFFVQVPIHNRLSLSHSNLLIEKLIFTNWIRTIAWTCKLMVIIKLYMMQ